MMKRFTLVNEILNMSKNRQFNFPQCMKINLIRKFNFTTTNNGTKTIDLIKILRAETSKNTF